MVVNSKANDPVPVSTNSSVEYSINGNFLNIKFSVRFVPFDLRNYRWTLFEEKREQAGKLVNASNEKLNWMNCTLFNYIPFAVIRAKKEGFYTSYENTYFEEVEGGWNLNSLDDIQHSLDFSDNVSLNDVIETDLKSKAVERLEIGENDPYWIKNSRGQTLNFTYGLNGNKFFSTANPLSSYNFDTKIQNICNNDSEEIRQNAIWTDGESNKVTVNAEIDISDDGEKRTYAVISANPMSCEIKTHFIQVSRMQPTTRTIYEYVPGTFSFYENPGNYAGSTIEQLNEHAVKININKKGNIENLYKISPRITFKIKKTIISE